MGFDHQTWGSISEMIMAGATVLGVASLWLLRSQVVDGRKALDKTTEQIRQTNVQLSQTTKQLELAKEELSLAKDELRTENGRYIERNALEAIIAYVNWGPPTLKFARNLVEKLKKKQCEDIEAGTEVKDIPMDYLPLAEGCFSDEAARNGLIARVKVTGATKFTFLKTEALSIRWLVVSQLSQLEIALLAWSYKIAWPELIIQQFEEHICPTSDGKHPILETYRQVNSGNKYYPALTKFINFIVAKRKKEQEEKDSVIPLSKP